MRYFYPTAAGALPNADSTRPLPVATDYRIMICPVKAIRALRLRGAVLPGLLLGVVLLCAAVLTLQAVAFPPLPNGLGLLPSAVALVQRSGVTLTEPTAPPIVTRSRAVAVARGQGSQDGVEQVILADVNGVDDSSLGSRQRLCWVILLRANPDESGDLPAPGEIDLYMVIVDAHSGRFLDGVIAFQGGAETGVGWE
jgi:hypothetical protein